MFYQTLQEKSSANRSSIVLFRQRDQTDKTIRMVLFFSLLLNCCSPCTDSGLGGPVKRIISNVIIYQTKIEQGTSERKFMPNICIRVYRTNSPPGRAEPNDRPNAVASFAES